MADITATLNPTEGKAYQAMKTAHQRGESLDFCSKEDGICDDCLTMMEDRCRQEYAVANAMAKLLNIHCPSCDEKAKAMYRTATPIDAGDLIRGRCTCCNKSIEIVTGAP